MRSAATLFLLFLICGCSQSPNEQLLLNDDWQFSEAGKNSYHPATVPGTIQTDLLSLGKIPDPFIGTNEDSIQWVSTKTWAYKKSFDLSEAILKKEHHLLRFEGLDTYATVRLNDSLILTANNAFRTWEVEVASLLKEQNELRIRFEPTTHFETEASNSLAYQLPEAPRVFTRKPQFQYGWDWGPKIKTMGIWRDVSLVSYDKLRIADAYFQTEHITDSLATLTLRLELDASEKSEVSIHINNKTTAQISSSLLQVDPTVSEYTVPIQIKHPKLWWPHTHGDPFLYDFALQIEHRNTVIDSISKKIGLRTVELITEKDSIGETFYFKVNGKPLYMKGANYIPQDVFLPRVNTKQREALLKSVVDANMNMLRIWGGGVYEDNDFYERCDEKGILLWQDFMFACAMYPGDSRFMENVKQEAIDNIKRLRQHPSIALWCGNNENSEGWHRWGWQNGKTEAQKTEIWSNYKALFNELLPSLVDSLHSAVSYWESSPKYGRGDERYQFEGDAHDWWVWHDGYPFEHFETAVPRFMSEFGFQAFPSYATIRYFTQKDIIDRSQPAFKTHQKHARGYETIDTYMQRDFPVPVNDEDYVYMSQLLQAYGITKGILAHRRYKPYNMGTLYWQLNDCWPAVSWSSIDALGHWKALHYKVKKAYANRRIIPWVEANTLKIVVADDTFTPITDSLRIRIMNFDGKEIASFQEPNITSGSTKEMAFSLSLDTYSFDKSQSYVDISFADMQQLYFFGRPKDLKLEDIPLKIETKTIEGGYEVSVSATSMQKDVFLMASEAGTWSDNFFDLPPNTTKVLTFYTTNATSPTITYKTLNSFVDHASNAL
ncbi:MAG: glycoside hydrolase family 2 protein [Flavobacteriales bacterium]|jgi:beta-mannosidase|uniref:beta-mannosidase n=1 Tax=Candidatus Ulvibacter alkanivorans TaxID=2267620 RepID=UPI000DF3765B|nr:glycoside hydrolase family 2 protein [Candidatus Ulvibacter alkanivorans]MCH2489795.1 glycoside hydrolase family 2 protein [Flavobacteriales bacterium]